MKEDLAFKQSKRLGHTRQHWDIFAALAQRGVKAGGGADKIFGTKPKVAEYVPTDLGEEAGRAVKQNIANYPQISKLLDSIVPGFSEMLKSGTKTAGQLIRGEIPTDVANAVRRSTAFRSLMGGFAGSMFGKALGARDFGKTSLDLQERGQNSAQRWAGLASGLSSPYMVSAAGSADASFRNKLFQQDTLQRKYNVEAAPDPGAKGTFDLQFALGMTAASIGAGMLGGKGYQGPPPGSKDDRGNGGDDYGYGEGGDSGFQGGYAVEPYRDYGAPETTTNSGIGYNMTYQPWYGASVPNQSFGQGEGPVRYNWGPGG